MYKTVFDLTSAGLGELPGLVEELGNQLLGAEAGLIIVLEHRSPTFRIRRDLIVGEQLPGNQK